MHLANWFKIFRYFYIRARNNSAICVKIADWYRATDYGVLYVIFKSQNMFCDLNYLTPRVCPSLWGLIELLSLVRVAAYIANYSGLLI